METGKKKDQRNDNAPDSGMQKFTQVTGVKDKAKIAAESAESSAKTNAEKSNYGAESSAVKYKKRQKNNLQRQK